MRKTLISACAILVLGSAARARQTTGSPVTAPRPVSNVTVPRTQSNRLPLQRQPGPGVIMGYVYWDASTIKHSPLNSCEGLSVTVDVGSETLGTFSAGHFSYIPSVGTLGVCAYAVNQMPVEQNLQVLINVTKAAAFSPAALPGGGGAVSINMMGGSDLCNNLPPAVPSPADLSRHWWTCPNYAYDVNFVLVRAPGSLSSRVAGPVRVAPGTAVELSPQPYPPKNGTLLTPGTQQTMLGTQANSPSGSGSKSAPVPAVQQPGVTDGTKQGATAMSPAAVESNAAMADGSVRPVGTPIVGASQTMSAQSNVTPSINQQGGTAMLSAPQRSISSYTNASNARLKVANGTVSGYIFWDRQRVAYNPSVACQGLSVKLSAIDSAGLQVLGTTTQFSWSTNPGGSLGLCQYIFSRVPEDVALMAEVTLGPSYVVQLGVEGPFPLGPTETLFKVSAQPCNSQQNGGSPSSTYLESGWFTCVNKAFNVNFQVVNSRLSSINRIAGPVRVAPGTAVELSPQPYPPKNGTLLAPGEQKTLLGDGSVRPATGSTLEPSQAMSAQGTAGSNAGSPTIPSKGNGRIEYEPMTTEQGVTQDKNFANWANSDQASNKGSPVAEQTGTTALATRAGNLSATRTPVGIREDPKVYVAQACAKDPSFRILFVLGTSDGKTLTVGPQYTIWGCSFGNIRPAKRPAPPPTSPTQTQTASYPSSYNVAVWTSQPFFIIDANTLSWSDNTVVVTLPPRRANHSGPSTAGLVLPAQVFLTRGDGQTTVYGSEGGVYFSPVN